MKIAVASGKGGTGKSTVSTNFIYILSLLYDNLALLDCDVEEPNCHIFIKPDFNFEQKIYVPVPKINKEKCIGCGKCAEVCQYNALAFVKKNVIVFQELCHGCGSCKINCPTSSISEEGREVGALSSGKPKDLKFNFVQGKSRIGEAMSPPLIKAVKKYGEEKKFSIQVLDCPPGTSCPVITAVEDTDFVILVTEPTPFGFYDLKLAVDVMEKLKLPFGIVINRSGDNNKLIEDWAKEKNIKILTKIPDDRRIAECYSKGELILKKLPEFKKYFEPLISIVKEGH